MVLEMWPQGKDSSNQEGVSDDTVISKTNCQATAPQSVPLIVKSKKS